MTKTSKETNIKEQEWSSYKYTTNKLVYCRTNNICQLNFQPNCQQKDQSNYYQHTNQINNETKVNYVEQKNTKYLTN